MKELIASFAARGEYDLEFTPPPHPRCLNPFTVKCRITYFRWFGLKNDWERLGLEKDFFIYRPDENGICQNYPAGEERLYQCRMEPWGRRYLWQCEYMVYPFGNEVFQMV